jgi:hypothetical protein
MKTADAAYTFWWRMQGQLQRRFYGLRFFCQTTKASLLRMGFAFGVPLLGVPMSLFSILFDIFFGCRHRHYTFPMTTRPRPGQNYYDIRLPSRTYVVCLDCAKQFPYDWEQMKVIWTPEKAAPHFGAPTLALLQPRTTENVRT